MGRFKTSDQYIMNIKEDLQNRILVLDGAMGTMIQNHNLTEDEFRGGVVKIILVL